MASDARRANVFFVSTSVVLAGFLISCLPLTLISSRLAPLARYGYKAAFAAAAVGHGYRALYSLSPKLPAPLSFSSLSAAAPALAQAAKNSMAVYSLAYCLLFLTSRFTPLALPPIVFGARGGARSRGGSRPRRGARAVADARGEETGAGEAAAAARGG